MPSARSWASPTISSRVPGVTTAMLVAFGENGIKTLEDLAGAETDDLIGWTERKKEKDAEPVRHKGVLEGFEMSRKDVEDMIMAARIAAGWVTQEDLDKMRAEQEAAAAAAEAAKAAAAQRRAGRGQGVSGHGAERKHRRWARGPRSRMAMPKRRTAVRCACAPSRAPRSRLRSSSASLPAPTGRSCRTSRGACPAAACGSTRRGRPWPRRCAARRSPRA